jgi:hypothetical protein
MERNAITIVRVLKRLKAAIGYYELGMKQHAVGCLDSLAALGKLGPFEFVIEVLRDEIIRNRENHVSAAHALEVVACMLPRPQRDAIGLTLSACYGQGNAGGRTANNVAIARGAKLDAQPNPAC